MTLKEEQTYCLCKFGGMTQAEADACMQHVIEASLEQRYFRLNLYGTESCWEWELVRFDASKRFEILHSFVLYEALNWSLARLHSREPLHRFMRDGQLSVIQHPYRKWDYGQITLQDEVMLNFGELGMTPTEAGTCMQQVIRASLEKHCFSRSLYGTNNPWGWQIGQFTETERQGIFQDFVLYEAIKWSLARVRQHSA